MVGFTPVSGFNIVIPAGADSHTGAFTLTPTDDTAHQNAETITVSGTPGSATVTPATITLTDDDTPGVAITETGGGTSVAENGGTDTYDVNLNTEPTHDVTVTVTSGDPSAATVRSGGGAAGATATLTFTTQNWRQAQTVTVIGVDDNVDNPGDSRFVTIAHTTASADSDYDGLTSPTVSVAVTDDDDAPTGITLSVSPQQVAENAGVTSLTVKATVGGVTRFGEEQTVGATVSGAAGRINAVSPFSFTIPAGADSGQGTFTLTPRDDGAHNGDTAVTVSATASPSGLTATATVTITDDDPPPQPTPQPAPPPTPTVTISSSPTAITEGGTATFTITANPAPSGSITVNLGVTENGDFAASGATGKGRIGQGKTVTVTSSGTAAYTVATQDDGTDEANGLITAEVANGSGYSPGATRSATVTVQDNDPAPPPTPEVSFASSTSSVGEGTGTWQLTVNLSPAPNSALTLGYGVSGTAVSGSDYAPLSGLVSLSSGVSKLTITVAITDDSVDESNETVVLTLSGGNGYSVGSPNQHTLTITDNDDLPPAQSAPQSVAPRVSVNGNGGVTEGGRAHFTITTDQEPSSALTVQLLVKDDSNGSNFVDDANEGSKIITIPAGDTSADHYVPTTDDHVDEHDGTVTVQVEASSNGDYTLGSPMMAMVQVSDNDDPPAPTRPAMVTPTPTPSPTPTPAANDDDEDHERHPTPTPSPTPTVTPVPTATPAPTSTPSPTATPEPTATPVPTPTATLRPTLTPTPSPTATPEPTATPVTTPMAAAIFTPTPTLTPVAPTPTPTPTPTTTPVPLGELPSGGGAAPTLAGAGPSLPVEIASEIGEVVSGLTTFLGQWLWWLWGILVVMLAVTAGYLAWRVR